MANRFTQRRNQGAAFKPLSFEELSTGPMMAQKMHQGALESAAQYDAQMQALPHHAKVARGIESEIDSGIESFTKDLNESGINEVDATDRLLDLKKRNEKLLGPGSKGAAVQGAFKQRQELKERLQKRVDDGEISSNWMQKNLAVFDKRSQKAYHDGDITYNGRMFANEANMTEKISEFLNSVGMDKITKQTGWKPVKNNGAIVWQNVETGEESRGTPMELKQMGINYAMQDPEIRNWLNDRAFADEQLGNYQSDIVDIYGNFSDQLKRSPEEVRNDIKNDLLNRSVNTAVRANDEIIKSRKYYQKNPTQSQLEGWGFGNPEEFQDFNIASGQNFNFGKDGKATSTLPITQVYTNEQKEVVPYSEFEKTSIQALKDKGFENFVKVDDEGNEYLDPAFKQHYAQRNLSDGKNFAKSIVDEAFTNISTLGKGLFNLVKLTTAFKSGNINAQLDATKDFKEISQNLESARIAVESSLNQKGYKTKEIPQEQREKYNKAFNDQMLQNIETSNRVLQTMQESRNIHKLGNVSNLVTTPEGYSKNYNNAVENSKEFDIKSVPTIDSDFEIERADKENMKNVIANRGDVVIYDSGGQKIKTGKDAINFIDNLGSSKVSYTGRQNVLNIPSEYTGSYNVNVEDSDGNTYTVLVPPKRNRDRYRALGAYNDLKQKHEGGRPVISDIPVIVGSNGRGVKLKKQELVSKNSNIHDVYSFVGKRNGELVEITDNGRTYYTGPEIEEMLMRQSGIKK